MQNSVSLINSLNLHVWQLQVQLSIFNNLQASKLPTSYFNHPLTYSTLELAQFWRDIKLPVSSFAKEKMMQCAFLCIACDLPAGRKVCGFLGHTTRYGCSQCFKEFPGTVGSMDYSGFDSANWPPCTCSHHRENASKVLNFTTRTKQMKLESTHGCRYSM